MFFNFFDVKGYLDYFEGESGFAFASRLVNSTQFQSFCDDYFSVHDALNFHIFFGILGLDKEVVKKMSFDDKEQDWPVDKPIVIDFRMPRGVQKFMIFEKLEFLSASKYKNHQDADSLLKVKQMRQFVKSLRNLYQLKYPLFNQ